MAKTAAKEQGAALLDQVKQGAQAKGLELANQTKQQIQEQGTAFATGAQNKLQQQGASLQEQFLPPTSTGNGPTPTTPQEGIPSTVDSGLDAIKKNDEKDQKKIEEMEAFKAVFKEMLEPSDERVALAMFVKGQIKEYEQILLPAIANSLPMEPNAKKYFIEHLNGIMNGEPQTDVPSTVKQPTAGGSGKAKAKSKKKRTKKPKLTRRRR